MCLVHHMIAGGELQGHLGFEVKGLHGFDDARALAEGAGFADGIDAFASCARTPASFFMPGEAPPTTSSLDQRTLPVAISAHSLVAARRRKDP